MSDPTRYPLSWPIAWPRTAFRSYAPFGKRAGQYNQMQELTVSHALGRLYHELDLLYVKGLVISTNVELTLSGDPRGGRREPPDPGAAIYFRLDGRDRCLACDKWTRVADNLAAIAKHIESLRGQDRWGVGTRHQAFAGYSALPPAGITWTTVLDLPGDASKDQILTRHRELVSACHPDRGGSTERSAELNAARDLALEAVS